MFSKFKVTSASNTYSTHFPLVEVYEAEIRRLRSEKEFLKLQYNSLVVQLNEAMAQLQRKQAENAPFNSSQKEFFQLSRRIKDLVIQSVKGIKEFAPIEIKFSVQGQDIIIPLRSAEKEDMSHPLQETTQHVLVAKDSGLISDEAYHELRMSLPEDARATIPPINVLKDERNTQNKIVDIHQISQHLTTV